MRAGRTAALLVAALAACTGVRLQEQEAMLASTAPPYAHFVTTLTGVRDLFKNATEALSTVEAEGPVRGVPPGVHAQGLSAPIALSSLASGVDTLRRVRAEISASPTLAPEVRVQVLWDMDRILTDAERLRGASLAPLARGALFKALQLRFGVLLTPAFWSTPIKRDLMNAGQQQQQQQQHTHGGGGSGSSVGGGGGDDSGALGVDAMTR